MRAAFSLALTIAACSSGDDNTPREIVWGQQPCDECHMAIEDRRFAAQLRDAEGEPKYFDDPGCLFAYVDAHPQPRATWFRNHLADGWVAGDTAMFARVDGSPMGYGFGAVPAGTSGAVPLVEARDAILARVRSRRGEP